MRTLREGLVLWLLAGCAASGADAPDEDLVRTGEDLLTWQEFYEGVERDADGIWVVDGDTPIDTEKRLVDFYEQLVSEDALTVARVGGRDSVWGATQQRALTYCVSTTFGARYDAAVQAMESATGAWESVADVRFIHLVDEDARCSASNASVLFDVRPTSGQRYLARAFFPYQSRASRNVLIDSTAYRAGGGVTLAGILRHELGHTLGFRHEHTRPEAGTCFEDNNWRAVTAYDRSSVMHYPQCNGVSGDLTISALDAQGAATIYGPPQTGGAPSPAPEPSPEPSPAPSPSSDTARSGSASGSLTAGQSIAYSGLAVTPGSTFAARMTGTGDTDLYVRWDQAPTLSAFDCRPYGNDSNETCELRVPDGVGAAHVMVHGYTASTYALEVEWVEP